MSSIPPPDQGNSHAQGTTPPENTWTDKFGRERVSSQELQTDDGRVLHDQESIPAVLDHYDDLHRDPRPWRIHGPDKGNSHAKGTARRNGRNAVARLIAFVRPRERRERHTARSSARSGDSGDSDADSERPRRRGELRHISESLADELNRIAGLLRDREVAR